MRRPASFLAVILLCSHFAAADQWPQFRGPNGDGIAEAKLPVKFGAEQNVKWKIPIHGKAWSSPVIWGDQLWLTTATEDGKKMSAICVDRHAGKVLRDIVVFENENPRFAHPTNSYASCTPVLEADRIYVHFGSYGTACLDTETGMKIWERRDFVCNHWRGPGSSPILHENKLIVAYDGYDRQFVNALDKYNGKTIWNKDRNIDYGTDNGDRKKAYSTATVIKHKSRLQVISPSAADTISYDPSTGSELWRVHHGGMNAAARPLYKLGLVYISAGSGPLSLIAVRPDGNGDVTKTHVEWGFNKSVPRRPSQIILNDLMFMVDDKGVASCINALTAEILWQRRLPGNGEYRASPILAGGYIYCFSVNGQINVIAASAKYKLVATNQLGTGFQASPAVADNSLYLRSLKNLYCIESK